MNSKSIIEKDKAILYKISVIVPVYKIECSLLRNSLQSIISQTYENMECILIDDGSPDNCGEICDEYAKRDTRVKVIHTENLGVSNARNTGLKEASGDFVMFVDGDDLLLEKTCISELSSRLSKIPQCDILFFRHIILDSNFEKINMPESSEKISEVDNNDVIYKIISEQDATTPYMYGSPWAKLIRMDFIRKNNVEFPLGIKKSQDRIFMARLLSFSPRLYETDYFGYGYFCDPESVCHKYNPEIIPILKSAASELNNTIKTYYEDDMQEYLSTAFCYFELKCIFNYNNLYFFAKGHKASKDDFVLFKQICNDNQKYIDKCKTYSGMTNNRKIELFLLKHECYFLDYFIHFVNDKIRKK